LFAAFQSASSEGKRYVLSELRYLLRRAPLRLPEAALRTALKLIAYNLGLPETMLSNNVKRKLTMHPLFLPGKRRIAS
jgi:rhamnosyltransferase